MSKPKKMNEFKKQGEQILMKLNNSDDWVEFDKDDILFVKRYTWSRYRTLGYNYVCTTLNDRTEKGYKTTRIFLTRYLLNAKKHVLVKVKDGNWLNAKKSNLSVAAV